MAATKDINEVDLLYNLKNRLNQDKTFTNVGPTLIIVNPFKEIKDVYGPEKIEYYTEKQKLEDPDLREKITEPHLYDSVLIAIREMLKKNPKNQALIVSGESGAGKTVATKNSMQCITYFFSKFNTNLSNNSDDTPLEKKILDCNPILEGFGNAKTVRNDNSSRFGKYVKIKLNNVTNVIEGAEMFTYLLEKSRVTELGPLERSYHIFYFLLRGADDNFLNELHLTRDIKNYDYLWHDKNSSQITEVPSINDVEYYKEVIDCFKSTKFTEEEIKQILKVISAVLLIGNLKFKIENNICTIVNEETYNNIAELLQVDKNELLDAITRKFLPSEQKYGGAYEESKIKTYFDGLAKELYNRCFLWIVKKLNKTLDAQNGDNFKYIGLLDIFGFECFQKEQNSIEQLCINYTNEQLQQIYIKDIFESDKLEFKKEGLESKLYLLDATYKDNKDVIKLIKLFFMKISDVTMEDKKIYDLVKDFDNLIKKDKNFKKVKENKFFVDKFVSPFFSVEHTAKPVEYSCNNFIDKNKDETKINVLKSILNSKSQIFNYIFTITLENDEFIAEKNKLTDDKKYVNKDEKFLGLKFCKEMKQLKRELKACNHHYIRCLKPNELKKPFIFHSNFVFNQIQYLGILATIQVRKNGFPMRRHFEDFCNNFKIIISKNLENIKTKEEYKNLSKEIIIELIGEEEAKNLEEQYLLGNSKIYMKQEFSQKLEMQKIKLLEKKIKSVEFIKVAIVKLKKNVKIKNIKKSIIGLQNYFNVNKSRINIQKKKEKIKTIQAMYKTHQAKNRFLYLKQQMLVIQNSLRIINSKRMVEQKKNILTCLSLHMQIYMSKIKDIHRKKMKLVSDYIINKMRVKIIYMEHCRIWNRVKPLFIRLLTVKKNQQITKNAKSVVMNDKYLRSFKIMQLNLLMKKTKEKKEKIKFIINFSSTKILSKYYIGMIKNILVIQKYMNVILNKKNIIKDINKDYFKDEAQSLLISEKANALDTLFPYTLNTENQLEENQLKIRNRNLKNDNNKKYGNNNIIKNIETPYSKTLKNKDYNDLTIYDNKTFNMTTLDKTRNMRSKQISNNSTYYDKTLTNKTDINTTGYSNRGYFKNNFTNNIQKNETYLNAYVYPKKGKQNNLNYNQYINEMTNKKNILKNELIPSYYNYKQATITVFAKILDIDIINDSNEIEHKSWSEEYMKIYKRCLKNNSPIQKIYIGNCHSMVLNSEGKVFTWGWNNYGQCGAYPESTKQHFILPEFKKGQNAKYPQLPIINYKTSDDVLPIKNIEDILLNDNFSIILTEKGNAISFGKNNNGELGLSHKKEIKSAQLISQFKNNVNSVKSTGNTNILLTKKNELFMWSISKKIHLQKPTMIYTPKRIQIESISTGKNFAILLTKNGICYGCGSNELGELGMTKTKYCMTPEEIIELTKFNERIIQVRCGYKHTICLSETGKCFSWGNNTYGQCGQKKNGINLPSPIFVEEDKTKIRIIQVACGFRVSFFLSYNRNIFYCGMLNTETKSKIPVQYNLLEKNSDISNEKEFSVVRILCSYSIYKNVFYASVADVRNIYKKFKNQQKIDEILDILAENWLNDKKYPPFIPEIAKFFKADFMKFDS